MSGAVDGDESESDELFVEGRPEDYSQREGYKDDFLKKYEACVASKVPAAQRATFQGQLEQMRKAWSDAAKNPSLKPTLEGACKQSAEQVKMALSGFGCAL